MYTYAYRHSSGLKLNRRRQSTRTLTASLFAIQILTGLLATTMAAAQQAGAPAEVSSSWQAMQLPDAPAPTPHPSYASRTYPYDESYLYHVGLLCGVGASTSPVSTVPSTGCGVGMTLVPLPVFVEVGVMAPQANRSHLTGYVSLDGSIPLAPASSRYLPMAIIGYSRLFETGHALDYGVALALPRFGKQKNNGSSLRLELRDYWTFASPDQHNVMLRLGWMAIETD